MRHDTPADHTRRAHLRHLARLDDVSLLHLSLHTILCDLAGDGSLSNLPHKSKLGDSGEPIRDVFGFYLNQRHPRVLVRSVVNTISKVTKPSGYRRIVELLDSGV